MEENEDEYLSSGKAPIEDDEKKQGSQEKSAKKKPRKISGVDESFLKETSMLHMGKYHSMIENTHGSAKRLYSPQISNRF